ncbi:hypothetical protein HDV06_001800 [Boothiomyces sp. JEL0866]|nr:hypothetical protein HDV06_001800 [Boothiomyces sp. JEL0866]
MIFIRKPKRNDRSVEYAEIYRKIKESAGIVLILTGRMQLTVVVIFYALHTQIHYWNAYTIHDNNYENAANMVYEFQTNDPEKSKIRKLFSKYASLSDNQLNVEQIKGDLLTAFDLSSEKRKHSKQHVKGNLVIIFGRRNIKLFSNEYLGGRLVNNCVDFVVTIFNYILVEEPQKIYDQSSTASETPIQAVLNGFKGILKSTGKIFLVPEDGDTKKDFSFEPLPDIISKIGHSITEKIFVGVPSSPSDVKASSEDNQLPEPIVYTLSKIVNFGNTIGDLLLVKDSSKKKDYDSSLESFVKDLYESSNSQAVSKILYATQYMVDLFAESILIKDDTKDTTLTPGEGPVVKSLKSILGLSNSISDYLLVKESDGAKYEKETQELFGQISKSKLPPQTLRDLLREIVKKANSVAFDMLNPLSFDNDNDQPKDQNQFIKSVNRVGEHFSNYYLVPKAEPNNLQYPPAYNGNELYNYLYKNLQNLLVESDVNDNAARQPEPALKSEKESNMKLWIQKHFLNGDSNYEGRELPIFTKENLESFIVNGQKVLDDILVPSDRKPDPKNIETGSAIQDYFGIGNKLADFVLANREIKVGEKKLGLNYANWVQEMQNLINNHLLVESDDQNSPIKSEFKQSSDFLNGYISTYVKNYFLNGSGENAPQSLTTVIQNALTQGKSILENVLVSVPDAESPNSFQKSKLDSSGMDLDGKTANNLLNTDNPKENPIDSGKISSLPEIIKGLKNIADSYLLVQSGNESNEKFKAKSSKLKDSYLVKFFNENLLNNDSEGKSFLESLSSVFNPPFTSENKDINQSTKVLKDLLSLYNSTDDEKMKLELLNLMEQEMNILEQAELQNDKNIAKSGLFAILDNILVEPLGNGDSESSWANFLGNMLVTDSENGEKVQSD